MSRTRQLALLVALTGCLSWTAEATLAQGCVDGSCVGGGQYAFAAGGPQPRAYGRTWGNGYGAHDWNRFYHYPYVYYPQNFWGNEYYKSADSLYYRYPTEMRIPVYNRKWHNYYPSCRPYHQGHHFILDVF